MSIYCVSWNILLTDINKIKVQVLFWYHTTLIWQATNVGESWGILNNTKKNLVYKIRYSH